jgi:DNA repair protein RadA/Sms
MGFRSAVVPAESPDSAGQSRLMDGMRVVEVEDVVRALGVLGMTDDDVRREVR